MDTNLEEVRKTAIMFLYLKPERIDDFGGMFITHPMFESVFVFNPKTEEMFNLFLEPDKYKTLLKDYADAIMGYDLCKIFISIRPQYKIPFFKHCCDYLSEQDFAKYLIECYTSCEVTSDTTNVSKKELLSYFKKADKQYLMDEEELGVLADLPNKVTIYRGIRDKKYINEMSWTLSLEQARWFANRFDTKGYVYKCTINKSYILCYNSGRGEQEIIIDSSKLKNYDIEEVA